jgi:hypothetical protein
LEIFSSSHVADNVGANKKRGMKRKKVRDISLYSPVVLTARINRSQATTNRMNPIRPKNGTMITAEKSTR